MCHRFSSVIIKRPTVNSSQNVTEEKNSERARGQQFGARRRAAQVLPKHGGRAAVNEPFQHSILPSLRKRPHSDAKCGKRRLLEAAYGCRGASTDVLSQEISSHRLGCWRRALKRSQMSVSSQTAAPRPDVSACCEHNDCSDTATVMMMTIILWLWN